MAGLDSIKGYRDGASVEGEVVNTGTDTNTPATGNIPTNKPIQTKQSPYSLGTPTGNVSVSPDLLERMQKIIDEREKQRSGWQESLRDATAWWSGGMAGPGEALARRAKEREDFDAETFGMRRDLAQQKTAQLMATADFNSLKNIIEKSGAGGVPVAGQPDPATVAEMNRLLNKEYPDVAGAKAVYNKWLANEQNAATKSVYDAAANEQKEVFIEQMQRAFNLNANEARVYRETGEMPFTIPAEQRAAAKKIWEEGRKKSIVPSTNTTTTPAAPAAAPAATDNVTPTKEPAVLTPGVTTPKQAAPLITTSAPVGNLNQNAELAIAAGIPVISGYRSPEKQAMLKAASLAPGYSGPPVAEPGKSLHQTGQAIDVDFDRLKPEQLKWLADNGYRQTLPKTDRNHFVKVAAPAPAPAPSLLTKETETEPLPKQKAALKVAAEPSIPEKILNAIIPSAEAAPHLNTLGDLKRQQELQQKAAESEISVTQSGATESSKKAGERKAKMIELSESAEDTIKAADMVIAANSKYPEATGLGKGMTGSNAAATLAGAVIPGIDKEKAEDQIADMILKKEEIAARDQIKTASQQLGIAFAADVFKGARMGIGLENMASNAKGISVHNLAENNIINAKIIKNAAIFNKERKDLFDKWAPKNGGKMADFEKFEATPEYAALKLKTQQRLAEELPNYLKLTKDGLVETKAGKAEESKFDKFRVKKQ